MLYGRHDLDKVEEAFDELLEYLAAISDEDKQQGLEARERFVQMLHRLKYEPERTLEDLRYSITGKGMLDWNWNDKNYSKLDSISQRIWEVIS